LEAKIVIPIVGEHGGKWDIAQLVEWKAKEGDRVKKGDHVVTVETDKASCDIEAEISGFLHILLQEGGKAMVGTAIGLIAETEAELKKLQKT
jgi:pyruvate dehydrogenase E2 component (dihydrolipoamide acetyltransferase)